MSDQYPSRILDKIIIRVPDGMRERIRRAAEENGRSVNAEILVLLEQHYPSELKLDEYVQDIAGLIEKQPPSARDGEWQRVIDMLESIRKQR